MIYRRTSLVNISLSIYIIFFGSTCSSPARHWTSYSTILITRFASKQIFGTEKSSIQHKSLVKQERSRWIELDSPNRLAAQHVDVALAC